MRVRKSSIAKSMTLVAVAGSSWLAVPREAAAQPVLCPSVVVPPDSVRVPTYTFDPSTEQLVFSGYVPTRSTGFVSADGYCTNDAGAFSGAALASQALSSLTQTTTQETTRTSGNAVVDRREAERQRCAEGFTRVNGECERLPPPVPEEATEAAPPRVAERAPKKAAKPTRVEAAAVERRKEAAPVAKAVRVAPPPPPPILAEPEARFGAWTQVIGDYERRSASGAGVISALVSPLTSSVTASVPLALNVSSRTGTVGFQAGADVTARGILAPGDGIIIGGFGGYVSSTLSLSTLALSSNPSLVGTGSSSVSARLSGATAGLYATYFDGPFSTDFLLKVDALTLNESFTDTLAFAPGTLDAGTVTGPWFTPYSSNGSTTVLNGTIAGNLNYRLRFAPNYWVEPTVGAQYTNTSYGANAAVLGLSDGSLVMVQGGARFGTSTLIDNRILLATTLTGLAYSDVLVSGGFIPGVGFASSNILAKSDQGQVRGRGVLAFNLDYGNGVKSFILGEVRGGQGLFGAGGKAGVRVEW
jgi:hypothetical protein